MKKNAIAIVLGIIFGLGLGLSKMTDPQVVLGFFDIAGNFNPMLLFVFIGALLTTVIGYQITFKRKQPIIDQEFHIPELTVIDNKLIFGASLFGIGWGISGYCPAPVIATVAINPIEFVVFVIPMFLAFYWVKQYSKLKNTQQ